MNSDLSPNAQAILLLTAPLIAGKRKRPVKPLSASEYRDLARHLHDTGREPADLFESDTAEACSGLQMTVGSERLHLLLGRGFLLAQAMERWCARAIWVVTRADPDYPQRLKSRLRHNAPPVLYGCGNPNRLNGGGLAVVGSRNVNVDVLRYAKGIGRLAAEAHTAIVSGGARGVDQAAMRGALEAGGRSVGILANGLERAALNRENRAALLDGRLLLVSPYDPAARFVVGHAMQRNKLIYALSDAALVVNSDHGHGGTWAGATEQLGKLRFVPVYVRCSGERSAGLEALVEGGAEPWPDPQEPDEMGSVVSGGTRVPLTAPGLVQQELFGTGVVSGKKVEVVRERVATRGNETTGTVEDTTPASADIWSRMPASAKRLLTAMSGEMTRQEILSAMGLRDWGNLRQRYLEPCLRADWIEMTIPDKPRSRNQRFRLTAVGRRLVEGLDDSITSPDVNPTLHSVNPS